MKKLRNEKDKYFAQSHLGNWSQSWVFRFQNQVFPLPCVIRILLFEGLCRKESHKLTAFDFVTMKDGNTLGEEATGGPSGGEEGRPDGREEEETRTGLCSYHIAAGREMQLFSSSSPLPWTAVSGQKLSCFG